MLTNEDFRKLNVQLVNTFVFDDWSEYCAFCTATRFAQSHIYANHVNKALEELHERLQNVKEKEDGTLSIKVSYNITRNANYALTQLGRSSMISEEMSNAIRKQFVKR